MKAYLQGPNGEETELTTSEPDPADGTYVVTMDTLLKALALYDDDGYEAETFWVRIVPDN